MCGVPPTPGRIRAVLISGYGQAVCVDIERAFAEADPEGAASAALRAVVGQPVRFSQVPYVSFENQALWLLEQ